MPTATKDVLIGALLLLVGSCTPPGTESGAAPVEDPPGTASPGTGSPGIGPATPQPTEQADHASDAVLSPRERDRRGDEFLFAGRFHESISDFDAFLVAEPALGPQHWRRGIALYYAGRYGDGAEQFVRHRTVNPDDVENAAWHFLCIARMAGVDQARASLLPVGPDQRDPMPEIYELMAGRATTEDVLESASSSPQRDAVFFAHLYLGLYFEVLGEPVKAREHMELAATTHGRSHYMARVAKMHASLLAKSEPASSR